MTTFNYREYMSLKKNFVSDHMESDMHVCTSAIDENNSYHKEYVFDDGAVFYEVMTREFVKTSVIAHGMEFPVTIELLRTEFWSSDDSTSRCYYEKV